MEFDRGDTNNFGHNKVHPGKNGKALVDKVYNLDTARSKESNEGEDANLLNPAIDYGNFEEPKLTLIQKL